MKKNIEKILASAGLIIALVLIVILIVTAFGGIEQSEFDNQLVRGLVITLSVLYLVLAVSSLTMLFLGSDAVREITLRSEQGGSCKATLGVIRRLVKETFYGLEGVKTGKVTLIVNEYGVKLKVAVRITDRDVFETETYLRTLLEEVFKGALGFKFHAIEFKIVSLQARFKPDKDKVDAAVAEKVAEHTANYAVVPNSVEQTSFGGDAAEEQTSTEREEGAAEAAGAESTAAEADAGAESAALSGISGGAAEEESVEDEYEQVADGEEEVSPEADEYDEEEKSTEEKAEADAEAEDEK